MSKDNKKSPLVKNERENKKQKRKSSKSENVIQKTLRNSPENHSRTAQTIVHLAKMSTPRNDCPRDGLMWIRIDPANHTIKL